MVKVVNGVLTFHLAGLLSILGLLIMIIALGIILKKIAYRKIHTNKNLLGNLIAGISGGVIVSLITKMAEENTKLISYDYFINLLIVICASLLLIIVIIYFYNNIK